MAEPVPFTFHAFAEPAPGPRWRAFFEASWPVYRQWYLKEGDAARPSYVTARRMLRTCMPELVGVYDRLVDLAGGGDVAARMLSLYRPPPYLAGCSQAAIAGPDPVLVRNYDYAPTRFEGVVQATAWGKHRVIGMSDCLWGLLDGMNDAGLAVSLTFGGRRVLGDGFGIPVVVRYLLETCATVAEAREALAHVPVNLAHNLTLVDGSGEAATALVSPDRAPVWRAQAVATNHQGAVEWEEHARFTRTVEREQCVAALIADPAIDAGAAGRGVPGAAALLHRVLARLRHAVHGRLPPGRGHGLLPLAGVDLDAVVRRLPRGHARRGLLRARCRVATPARRPRR